MEHGSFGFYVAQDFWDVVEALQKMEVDQFDRIFSYMFPADLHFKLGSALFPHHLIHSPPGDDQLTALLQYM